MSKQAEVYDYRDTAQIRCPQRRPVRRTLPATVSSGNIAGTLRPKDVPRSLGVLFTVRAAAVAVELLRICAAFSMASLPAAALLPVSLACIIFSYGAASTSTCSKCPLTVTACILQLCLHALCHSAYFRASPPVSRLVSLWTSFLPAAHVRLPVRRPQSRHQISAEVLVLAR